jgi:hypothetical protein
VTASASEAAAEATDFDLRAVRVLHPGGAVAAPAVGEVEALGYFVATQDPEDRFGVAGLGEEAAGLREQLSAGAGAPVAGVDVEGVDLTRAFGVVVAGGAEDGEADDPLVVDGDDRLRVGGGGRVEVVPLGPLLRLQRVEEVVGDQAPVGDLPGADMDARDVKTLVRAGSSDYEAGLPFWLGILKQACDEETLMPSSPDSTKRSALRLAISRSSRRARS